jgi:NADH:ubiquinone oxidoreductase subunit 2 (subunit N)
MITLPLILVILAIRSLTVLSRNSWMVVWVALEINTLSFCTLMSAKDSNKKKSAEAAIKYFIIQSASSAIMVLYLSTPTTISGAKLLFISGTAAILIKLASAPFHSWFLEILPKISTKSGILLITWQKLAPIYILIFIIKTAVLVRILIRAVVGSITQLNKNKLIEIIALSSVFNLRWIILAVIIRTQRLFIFVLAYWRVLISVLTILTKQKALENSINIEKTINPIIIALAIARLAGIPPTLGFYAKLQVITQALKLSLKEVATLIVVIRAMNFYIYLRITTSTTTVAPSPSQKNQEKRTKYLRFVLVTNFLPMVVIIV